MPSEQAIADVQAGLTCTNPIDREDIVRVLENYRDDVEVAITLLNDFGGVPPWMLAEGSAEETAFHQRRREYLESLTSAAVAPAVELPSPVDDMGVKTVVMPTQQDDDDPGCTCDISLPDIDEETRNRCLCGWTLGILSVGILLMVILVPLSFCGVERQYMGFMWNRLTTVDTTKIYENGNHFVGLNRLSLTYPTTYQAICYSSDDLTFAVASGQVISIDLCFHYVIQKAGLADLFRAYGLNFDPRIASIGRSAIKNAAATFVLDQFITDRDTVQAGMLTALRANLASSSVNVSIPVDGFILGQIILPTSVLDRNLAIFEQTQLQVQQGYELTATLTRYDTRANISSINASTTIVLQQATAVANRMRTAATLAGVSTLRGTVGVLIQNMSTRLQVKNATAVATLAKYTLLLSSADRNGGLTAATPGITVVADSLVNIIPQI